MSAPSPLPLLSLPLGPSKVQLPDDILQKILDIVVEQILQQPCANACDDFPAVCSDDSTWRVLCEKKGWLPPVLPQSAFDDWLENQEDLFANETFLPPRALDFAYLKNLLAGVGSAMSFKREFVFRCAYFSVPSDMLPLLAAQSALAAAPPQIHDRGMWFADSGTFAYFNLDVSADPEDDDLTCPLGPPPSLLTLMRTLVLPPKTTRIDLNFMEYRRTVEDPRKYIVEDIGLALERVLNMRKVKFIGRKAFFRCRSLNLEALPDSLIYIDIAAFRDCTSLALTALPKELRRIDKYAFANCTSLALTALPESVNHIGTMAFKNCPTLQLTTLPRSLVHIGESAFEECSETVQDLERDWRLQNTN